MGAAKRIVTELLGRAEVGTDGAHPWDLRVLDERFYDRVLAQSSLGFGDSYVEGWWECERIDEMICRLLQRGVEEPLENTWRVKLEFVRATLLSPRPAVTAHYDLGNEFFEQVLGKTVMYSCAYWRSAIDLDAAQLAKIDLVTRKLEVERGEHVLDLGCGWGAVAEHLARELGCKVTAVTNSVQQAEYVRRRCEGLPVEVLHADYLDRSVLDRGPYDKIACVGMMEHVGRRSYRTFISLCADLLARDGLFLLHTIGTNVSTNVTDPWIERRIFPGGMLASPLDITRAAEGRLVLEDWHNFAADYDRTLMAWYDNFVALAASGRLDRDIRFERTWRYYLQSFAGCFRTRRTIQLYQVVFSHGKRGGYVSVR